SGPTISAVLEFGSPKISISSRSPGPKVNGSVGGLRSSALIELVAVTLVKFVTALARGVRGSNRRAVLGGLWQAANQSDARRAMQNLSPVAFIVAEGLGV